MKRLAPIAFVVLIALAAAACGSNSGSKGAVDAIKEPPKTVVLMTYDSYVISKSVLAAFTEQTGFTVKVLKTGDAGQLVSTAGTVKDHPEADALFGIDNTFLTRGLDENLFEPYTPRGLDAVPARFQLDPTHRVTPIDSAGVCVNDDLAWFGDDGHPPAPNSLADLTKPAYKKLLVVENPATSSPGLAFLLTTISEFGTDWHDYWKALKSNGVRVVDSWDAAYQTDFTAGGSSGDRPLVVSYATDPAADVVFSEGKKKTPTVGVVPGTCFAQTEFAGVLRGAKNPTGARALLDFMLTRAYQEDLPLNMYVYPVLPGAQLPPVFLRFATQPPARSLDPDEIGKHRTDWINEWTRIALR